MPRLRPLAKLVARAKPRIPDALWPTLLTARSLLGDGPVLGLPPIDRALVLVAHPDDETLGCGGTMALLSDAGAQVELLAGSDGEATIGSALDVAETGRRRRVELDHAAAILGATVRGAGLPDGHLGEHRRELADAIAAALERLRPQIVLAPWPGDGHRDHRAVAFALGDALRDGPADVAPDVWGYETWSALPPNRFVDVTEVHHRKVAAMECHRTAALALELDAGVGLSRWRSLHAQMGRGYAEAFLAVPAPRYVELVGELAAFDDTGAPA